MSWSGIDAGRREQVGPTTTGFRHFRRSRRSVKPAADSAGSPPTDRETARPRLAQPWPAPLELTGSHAYLRELRRLEMDAWERTGGDVYRPSERMSMAETSTPVAVPAVAPQVLPDLPTLQ